PSDACRTSRAPRIVQTSARHAEAASLRRRRKTDGSRGNGGPFFQARLEAESRRVRSCSALHYAALSDDVTEAKSRLLAGDDPTVPTGRDLPQSSGMSLDCR